MRIPPLLLILILAALVFGGRRFYDLHREKEELTQRLSETQAALETLRREMEVPGRAGGRTSRTRPAERLEDENGARAVERRAVCPLCRGSGSQRTRSAAGHERQVACPQCGGAGHRALTVPPGFDLCRTCSGMGRVVERSPRFGERAISCPTCGGSGLTR